MWWTCAMVGLRLTFYIIYKTVTAQVSILSLKHVRSFRQLYLCRWINQIDNDHFSFVRLVYVQMSFKHISKTWAMVGLRLTFSFPLNKTMIQGTMYRLCQCFLCTLRLKLWFHLSDLQTDIVDITVHEHKNKWKVVYLY